MIGTFELEQIQHMLMAAVLCMPRMMVCMFLIPVFEGSTVPRTVRIALALGLTLPVIFGTTQVMAPTYAPLYIAAMVLKECFLGLVLGIALSAPFWAISGVGILLDNQRGANAGSQGTPMGKPDESMIGLALQQSLVVALATSGGLIPLYQLLLGSYDAWPILSLFPDLSGADAPTMFARFAEFTKLALLYSAPVLGSLLLIDFAFALIGLAAPNLPTYFAAMPVKSITGLFVTAIYIWVLLDLCGGYFTRSIEFDSALINRATNMK
jgi:type III secretion protein T